MPILDHIELAVRDAEISREFYERALAPLGVTLVITVGQDRTRSGGMRHGLGVNGYPCLWLHDNDMPGKGTHIAFAAKGRSEVDAFYEEALRAGGADNGAPGIRQRYHDQYYAAYVLDPDGMNVEVVFQGTANDTPF